jgi:hypothetical protein
MLTEERKSKKSKLRLLQFGAAKLQQDSFSLLSVSFR